MFTPRRCVAASIGFLHRVPEISSNVPRRMSATASIVESRQAEKNGYLVVNFINMRHFMRLGRFRAVAHWA